MDIIGILQIIGVTNQQFTHIARNTFLIDLGMCVEHVLPRVHHRLDRTAEPTEASQKKRKEENTMRLELKKHLQDHAWICGTYSDTT